MTQPSATTDLHRLLQLVNARHPCVSIVTPEEDEAVQLVRSAAFEQGMPVWQWEVIGGVREGLIADAHYARDTEHPAAGLYHLTTVPTPCLMVLLDLVPHLREERVLRLFRRLWSHARQTGSTIVLVDHTAERPELLHSLCAPFELSLPSETELEQIVRATLKRMHQHRQIEVDIKRSTLQVILRNLRGLSRGQAERVVIDCVAEDRRFDEQDINTVLASKRRELHTASLLEYVETPVNLDEIGGLNRLKQWLEQRHKVMSDETGGHGLETPRGVLLLGVQGAGKSLCAKAIATAWQRPLLRMDVGALYDQYIGQSERRLRDALRQAQVMAPIVLWIDEIEKAFASAASRSTDGGLSQRMFGALLTWMQEHRSAVFLVATANDIEALPPELLRKGRFDEIFFVDLPDEAVRARIFAIHLRRRKRDSQRFDLPALAQAAEGFSGAEIEQAVVAGLYAAHARDAELTTEILLAVLRESPPLSVTMAERIAALRAWAHGRCIPAD